jgi:hypothetical protein
MRCHCLFKIAHLQNFLHLLAEPFTRDTPLKFDKRTSTVATPMSALPSKIPASSPFPDCRRQLRISRICPASRATRIAAALGSLKGHNRIRRQPNFTNRDFFVF